MRVTISEPARRGEVPDIPLDLLVNEAGRQHGVSPTLIRAVIDVESGGNPRAVSSKGAQGLMQLMPGTANILGVRNPFDPWQNVDGGARHLRDLLERFGGNVALALAGYNAGAGAVAKYGGIPPYDETKAYVRTVMSLWRGEEKPRIWQVRNPPQSARVASMRPIYRWREGAVVVYSNVPRQNNAAD
ncbi:lytic transglycosylase domain-containing protein [Candidatus Parcubacteria bacterium]|nr:MAG: lytic transglycosylase domain-containing protein [Candidatus Parcubacteria bacterium]